SPAIALPWGRWASSTRLSTSTSAQATTRRRRSSIASAAIVAVDRDVLFRQVAGPHRGGAAPEAEVDPDGNIGFAHDGGGGGLGIVGVARALPGDADVAEPDRQPVALGGLPGLADGHDDAAPVGVLAGDGGLHQRRVGDRQ